MARTAHDKLANARRHWHKTIGEHVVRTTGIALALVAIAVSVAYGLYYGWEPGGPPTPYRVVHTDAARAKQVLLIASVLDDAADGLSEAIRSYFGARITPVADSDLRATSLIGIDCVIVLSNVDRTGSEARRTLLSSAVDRRIPVYWIGTGLPESARVLGLASFEQEVERRLPANSYLTYKGVDVEAEGLPFLPGYPSTADEQVEVIASVRVHDAFLRPAAVRSAHATYLAFNPFALSGAVMALPVAIDILADTLGKHDADPRVVVRLEDINAVDYAEGDSSFSRVAAQMLEAGIFVHVAVTPVMVDSSGRVVADIGGARNVIDFLKTHPSQSAVVQHGTRHHRADPRNAGKASGDAYEFFFDDDATMGRPASMRFAQERLTEGRELMSRLGLAPLMFEAPHLEMSPGEEAAARHLFPVMMHPPLFFGRASTRFQVQVAWMTERNGTVYAPSDVGYVDALDERSVDSILARLHQLRRILPDPLAVVFYHPFMIDKPGREGDLPALIAGFERLGYRSVSLLDEVERVR